MSGRRRRAVVLLSLSLASGGLATSLLRGRANEVEAQVGPLTPVLVAASDIAAGTRLSARRAKRLLAVRQVPERFAPLDSLRSEEEAVGARAAMPVARGSPFTAGHLEAVRAGGERRAVVRRGERALEVAVSGSQALPGAPGQGVRVDVLVTTEPRAGPGRTYLALEDVELLALRASEATPADRSADAPEASAVATLRVTLRQAVFLTAAQNFGRELRLLGRPPGDGRRLGRAAVASNGL